MDETRAVKISIRQAAFALAERMGWRNVGMGDIAREAGLSLSQLVRQSPSRAAILEEFARDIDEAMVLVFEKHPSDGEPHDRLFEVMVKRLEILAPYRVTIGRIVREWAGDPVESLVGLKSIATSVEWMISAARVDSEKAWQGIGRIGLMQLYVRLLAAWAQDEDPGLTRSMAIIDRGLRDIAQFSSRATSLAGAAAKVAQELGGVARRFFEQRST